MVEEIKNSKIISKRKLFLNGVVVLLFFGLLSGFIWSFVRYQDVKEQIDRLSSQEGRAELAQQEISSLLDKIGQLIVLPKDENPLVATIQDAAALAEDQAFYKDAQNGDKLIVYSDKAFIYREKDNRLVNVGPVFRTPTVDEALIQVEEEGTQPKE